MNTKKQKIKEYLENEREALKIRFSLQCDDE